MAPFDEGEPWTSYVSLLGPVLDLRFPAIIDGEERNYTIRELAHRGIIQHDGTLLGPPPSVTTLL
jgi:hypothetical protein